MADKNNDRDMNLDTNTPSEKARHGRDTESGETDMNLNDDLDNSDSDTM